MRLYVAVAAFLAFLAFLAPASAQYHGPTVDVPQLMMPGPLGDKGLGDPNAPVTVVEYASLTCPHCQRFHADSYPTLKSKYIDTGKVYFILREFPLDPLGFAAFMVARCSGDNYYPVIQTLFDHQEAWAFGNDPVPAMLGYLRPYGIGPKEFTDCIDNQAVFDHIDFVSARGYDIFGVEGTPTFFINGSRMVGVIPPEGLEMVLNALLATRG
jgi:protein-disulfide isomerase